ncbi:MAG: hypothetical protein ACPLX7_06975 [Candidatus Kapaibacteriota bacterium]|jgi:hypothetical protein
MKAKILVSFVSFLVLVGCVSVDKTRDEYFGFNNNPKYEEKEQATQEKSVPYVYSHKAQNERDRDARENNSTTIINNYFPYPYDPSYLYNYDPYDLSFFLYYGNRYYDPFWDYYVIYVPYNHKHHHYVYYPYPYWDYYWWERRPRVIFVPYDYKDEKPRERTVRDFGPSRGGYDGNQGTTPTKEPRSETRGDSGKKTIVRPNEPSKNKEPVEVKLPEKPSTPREAPKSEPNTKQERSSTRPR